MEAVAAFSLTCNVFEVVGFASKAIEICVEFYKHGSTIDIKSLRETSAALTQTTTELETSLSAAELGGLPSSGDARLADLGRKVGYTANLLQNELVPFHMSAGSGRWAAFVKTAKLKWRSSRIEQSRRRLDEHVKVLNTQVLADLRQWVGKLMVGQSEDFELLNRRHQELGRMIVEGSASVDTLIKSARDQTKSHVTHEHQITRACAMQEHEVTRAHFDRLETLIDVNVQKAEFEKFLQSLHFPEINLRQDTVSEAHRATFEWIFESQQSGDLHSFADWLQNDDQLYWILGKPGSGKSTLMKYILQNRRTQVLLDSSGRSTHLLAFFFWETGVDMQKSQEGLLRSLVYQLLKSMDSEKRLQTWRDVIQPNVSALPTVWTSKPLLQLLAMVLGTIEQCHCLFLDGLDEFQQDPDRVKPIIDLHSTFKRHSNFKLCISSRPEPDLRTLYDSCPSLTMQELTRKDIRRYVNDALLNDPQTKNLILPSSFEPQTLVNEVVDRADGIFLWVSLVVQSLIRGVRNEDSWDDLQKRLEDIPRGIFDLYTHMWKRHAADFPVYAEEAATYLQAVLRFSEVNLLDMAIPVNHDLHTTFSDALENHNCMGQSATVRLAHRTVAEYLSHPSGQDLLLAYAHTKHDLSARYLKTILISTFLSPPLLSKLDVCYWNRQCFRSIGGYDTPSVFFDLESIFQKFFAWKIWTVDDAPLEWLDANGNIDYTQAFIGFSHPEYTKLKLEMASRPNNQQYLTHLLSCWARAFGYFQHPIMFKASSTWLSDLFGNASLLLSLGANPNGLHGEERHFSGVFNMTIWTSTVYLLSWLLSSQYRNSYSTEFSTLLRRFLESGADIDSCITYYDQNMNLMKSRFDGLETSLASSFVLCKWSALDLALIQLPPDNELCRILVQFGSPSAKKRFLWYEPPDMWFVQKSDANPNSIFWNWKLHISMYPYQRTRYSFWYDQHPDYAKRGGRLDHTLVQHIKEFDFFGSGMEAIEAAGWTIEEIQSEPCLAELCECLLRSPANGEGNIDHGVANQDIGGDKSKPTEPGVNGD